MIIKQILESQQVRDIEKEIVEASHEQIEKMHSPYADIEGRHMFAIRKKIINRLVLQHQDELLPDIIAFNDALREALRRTYRRAIDVYKACQRMGTNVEVEAFCAMADYQPLYPAQNDNREIIWTLLTDLDWNPSYKSEFVCSGIVHQSFDDFIGCNDDNIGSHLDLLPTKDLHLIRQFHQLFERSYFAITDFIYCREFNCEIEMNLTDYDILWSTDRLML